VDVIEARGSLVHQADGMDGLDFQIIMIRPMTGLHVEGPGIAGLKVSVAIIRPEVNVIASQVDQWPITGDVNKGEIE
jgi:hypothetical protein